MGPFLSPSGACECADAAERTLSRLSRTFPADFWRLWSVGLISSIVRWIETVVVGEVAAARR